jgi:phosphoenolpyruvate-protein phosphotransferase
VSHLVKGIGASAGIAIGSGWVFRPIKVEVERLDDCDPLEETTRLDEALAEAKSQVSELRVRTLESIGEEEAAIFEAHQMFLDDPEFITKIKGIINDQKINAEAAVEDVVEHFAGEMLALEDEYFRARAQDIRDVGRRVIYCLSGVDTKSLELPKEPVIILADDLTPSDTVQFDRRVVLGLCTVRGGPTSHTAILARSLGVPAAVSVPFRLDEIEKSALVILDGGEGKLTIDPSDEQVSAAKTSQTVWQADWQIQLAAANKPAVTLDGHTVEVVANIGNVVDARQAIEYGAEGIGLLRTEFLYMDRQTMPDEGQQVSEYKDIFDVMGNRLIVVRTLDIGGDKEVAYLGLNQEPNPFLGWRAIRMIGERPEILHNQFRALLRAGVGTDLRIMIPLVSNLDEVIKAHQILDEARQALINEQLPAAENVQFGIMVEVPSAALMIEHIAGYVDFFSIGTNDLTQYTLAIDRTNERVAGLASPFHPAVIQLIALTIETAHTKSKWVGLCGEMAGDPLATPFLLGLGLDEFSMAPISIPVVKQVIRNLELKKCREIARTALRLSSTEAVKEYLSQFIA